MGRVHFILHSMDGFVIAAGAYSVKDHEYIVSSEEIVPVHGSIRWFVGHTFDPVATDSVASVDDLKKGGGGVYSNQLPKASDLVGSVRPSVVVMWVLVSATVSVGLCALLYEGVLKPRIVREAAKRK